MSKSLFDYGVGQIGIHLIAEQRKLAEEKWEQTGFLKGLKGTLRSNMATLFENQLTDMWKRLDESTDSGSSGQYQTVAFPIIRRVFTKLLANDIVSVQALTLPIGKLYFMNPKVSVRTNPSPGRYEHTVPDGAYENAYTQSPKTTFEDRSLYDAFYSGVRDEADSLFDISKGSYTLEETVIGTVTATSGQTPTYATLTITGLTVTNRGKLVGAMGVITDTEEFISSLNIVADIDLVAPDNPAQTITAGEYIPFNMKMVKYGKPLVDANGNLVITLDLNYYDNNRKEAGYSVASNPTFTAIYRAYDTLEENSQMSEVTFELEEITISVGMRKMRTQWTQELAQDVGAFHNIDAEGELTNLLSEQMAIEIDREILQDLRREAAWLLKWDANGYLKGPTFYGVQKDYNQELMTKIYQISSQIHKATLRGGASWVVVSTEISAILNNLEYFHVSDASPEQDKYNMGIEKIGSLNGRLQVYRDPYAPAESVLIGHKGSSILEAGYVYAPYVPMQLTPVLTNPFDFKQIRAIMTRYAKKMVMNRFYGKIRVENVVTFPPIPFYS